MSDLGSLIIGSSAKPGRVPSSRLGLKRRLLDRLAARLIVGSLTVQTPSGEILTFESDTPQPAAVLVLHRWRTLRRLLLDGDIGFAEAYLDGDWSSPNIPALIELAALNDKGWGATLDGALPRRVFQRLRHALSANSKKGSRRNIPRHYDLGNEFYAQWLDAGMSYSSAIYQTPDQPIEAAQAAKQDRAVELLGLIGGEQVLEIGCGWGGLAERIVQQNGTKLTGITLSPAQLAFARQRLAASGLDRRADLRLQDYREVNGKFDRIVSIEMLEAVGQAYWPTYFSTIRNRLKPGGVAVLQGITIDEHRFQTYRNNVDFIQRYIFPGGMLPSVTEMRRQIDRAGLRLVSMETFGQSYARTLAEWNRRFQVAWPKIEGMGFSPRFKRMWEYYLAYCEGGFAAGAIDVGLYKVECPA
jgi:cyclopropane-fatty-acyl-phospholipid synthase